MANLSVNIGRSSSSDYIIPNPDQHPTVSGNHATIYQINDGDVCQFKYVDHSTNGSYINGEFVHNSEKIITSSDHITLGRTYTLDLSSIVTNYFDTSKTTKKKDKTPSGFVAPPVIDPVPPIVEPAQPIVTDGGATIDPKPEPVHRPGSSSLPQSGNSKDLTRTVLMLLAGAALGFLIALFLL